MVSKEKKVAQKRMTGYITLADVTDKYSALEKFKLFFTTTYSSDAVIPPEYIKAYKNELCTETFLLIGPFNSEIQMNNCASYMDTNFFRFLLFIGHGTMQVNQSVFSYIPLQDFTKPWTDEELYKKYNLTDDEISFIESMIKPME
jgi:site-specific DNA-methyltransferase (adenine-specific)